ncbi:MAG: MFS transporter [Xanthomonadales bacterium]|nr:MFS transporter [Xanthomonadales bacterium]
MSALISQRRFGPFFWTQAMGAFNDNVYKQALLILITYQGVTLFGMGPEKVNNIAAAIFILPFFLLSAVAGQIAEKYEKSLLIRRIKACEILFMALAGMAFWTRSIEFLLLVLFLMGAQSTFFGPIKYSILPQILETHELVKGNGQISMATFVAILLGSLTGGALIAIAGFGWILVTATVLLMAAGGYLISRRIPPVTASDPELRLDLNIARQTVRLIGYTRENLTVFRSVLGISWFWFFGSVLLPQLPPLVKNILMGDESVAILVFTLFSVGIGVGSLLCDKLSVRRVEIGLVPLGSIGLSVFGIDLYFAAGNLAAASEPLGILAFLGRDGATRMVADVLLMGVFGGFYIVPLNALIQHRSKAQHRSRVIAGANVLNAAAMVLAGVYSVVMLSVGLSVIEVLLTTAVLNIAVALYIYLLAPEFLLRFAAWVLVNTVYRIHVRDLEKIPEEGPALLVCNHVSFVDALVIGGSIRRPVRFVMYYKIFNWPILRGLFRAAKTIPIASRRESPELLERAYERIAEELDAGEVVCIFPEGRLSTDGEVSAFRRGVERIVAKSPVPVVPMGLTGLWGSLFSHSDGGVLKGPPRRLFGRIELRVGDQLPPEEVSADNLRTRVLELVEAPGA